MERRCVQARLGAQHLHPRDVAISADDQIEN
jgi:hypothetical protein